MIEGRYTLSCYNILQTIFNLNRISDEKTGVTFPTTNELLRIEQLSQGEEIVKRYKKLV